MNAYHNHDTERIKINRVGYSGMESRNPGNPVYKRGNEIIE